MIGLVHDYAPTSDFAMKVIYKITYPNGPGGSSGQLIPWTENTVISNITRTSPALA